MIVYERPFITITYFEAEELVYTEWHGFANSQEYRETLNAYVDVARKYKVTKWIGNTKDAKAIRPVDQEWTLKEWLPDFSKYNIKRMAVIVSKDIFNKMAVNNLLQKGTDLVKFDTMYFDDFEEAKKWVSEVGS